MGWDGAITMLTLDFAGENESHLSVMSLLCSGNCMGKQVSVWITEGQREGGGVSCK